MINVYRKIQKGLLIFLAVVLVIVVAVNAWAGDYYRADIETVNRMALESGMGELQEVEDGVMVCYPQGAYDAALIFYPGGKVEPTAYLPLMASCAEEGILCVLVPMPLNLAVLNSDAAAEIPERFPEVEHWYMAGHSLGGSMAASFSADADWVEGLILLAAYSTEDVTDLPTLSIYGSEDGVLNMEKYEKYRSNLPADFTEVVLEGGNHAYFGVYGEQDGDGEATITNLEQITETAKLIAEFVR